MTTTTTPPSPHTAASRRPLLLFAATAVPVGWLLLGTAVAADLPVEPFVLGTLVLGLVLPAVLLTRRERTGGVRALLRDCVRLPRPLLLVPAAVLVPGLTWLGARLAGSEEQLTGSLGQTLLVNVVSSVLIVNLWEELAWQGFFQRRASAGLGVLAGPLLTAAAFVAVHLPLAFADADDASDVALGLAALVGSGIGLRLLLGALDRTSGGSLLVVAVAHASFNAAAELVAPHDDWIRYVVTLGLGLLAAVVLVRGERAEGAR